MSGAKNCPETPRQKMIGMMYLVLTAMLALNVSADILNGFIMVNKSLLGNIETGHRQKTALYDEMQYLYDQNPDKVGEWLQKSKLVQQKSDSLLDFIHQVKADLMMMADGVQIDKDTVNRHILQKKDNIDIVIMLGDHHDHDIELIREYNSNIKIIGILGNHDGFDFLERNGVEDINGRVYEANGVRIAGMQGSFKYKNVDYPSFTQEQSRVFAENMGPADIFITHDSPRGCHERKDDAHIGLEGIREYIMKNNPIINIHGHQHSGQISVLKNGTIVIGIYGAAILDMNNFTLKKVF